MKKCTKCREVKSNNCFYPYKRNKGGLHSWCKNCALIRGKAWRAAHPKEQVEYAREYRRKNKDKVLAESRAYYYANPDKVAAHRKVNHAIRDGKLLKEPCEVCGTTVNVQAHHDDYSKELEITWLCSRHHTALHMRTVQEAE